MKIEVTEYPYGKAYGKEGTYLRELSNDVAFFKYSHPLLTRFAIGCMMSWFINVGGDIAIWIIGKFKK